MIFFALFPLEILKKEWDLSEFHARYELDPVRLEAAERAYREVFEEESP